MTTDESPDFEARFASLEDASRKLSGDVQALNATLVIVNKLQRTQREQSDKQLETEREIARSNQESSRRDARTRHVVGLLTLAMAILLPLVSILVYYSLILRVNELLDASNEAGYQSCLTRNVSAADSAAREEALAKFETNPKIASVHLDSAAKLRNSHLNCEAFKRTSQ